MNQNEATTGREGSHDTPVRTGGGPGAGPASKNGAKRQKLRVARRPA